MPDPNPSRVYFEGSQPILRVDDMKAALAFYVDKLGFQNASWGTDEFTSVNRDRAGIYLCRGGQGRGAAWVWIGVDYATRLHNELVARCVAIRMPLTNFSWRWSFTSKIPTATSSASAPNRSTPNAPMPCLASGPRLPARLRRGRETFLRRPHTSTPLKYPASYPGIASAMPQPMQDECRLQALRSSRKL